MATKRPRTRKQLTDEEIADRLRSMLINTAEGRRSIADDRQYPELRNELTSRGYDPPDLVFTHPSLDSFTASLKRIQTKPERVQKVRDQFEPFLQQLSQPRPPEPIDSSLWTGQQGRVARLKMVRTLLPLAQSAVESMIADLSAPNPNGGPILDEREEALKHLRELHRSLGELLAAADAGHLDDELGKGLQAETARFAKRAARALRSDPAPYVSSALLLGIFTACGLPGIGGYLADVALSVRKHKRGGAE
jgi:hypothetical protein